ncbi:MAG: GntP family permease [Bacteroidales bacterium]
MSLFFVSILLCFTIFLVILFSAKYKLNSFVVLFGASLILALIALPADLAVKKMKDEFGNTMGSIGLLIILGAFIGIALDESGAMNAIARFVLSKTGTRRSKLAIAITGYITGLPIFCDSGYIILSGLANSFASIGRIPIAVMASVLATSLYSVHCLIPPHPGATAAAGIMEVNMGNLILAGTLVAIPTAIAAYAWIHFAGKKLKFSDVNGQINEPFHDSNIYPSVWKSLLPILIPLTIITVKSLWLLMGWNSVSRAGKTILFIGDPVIALSIGACIILFLPGMMQFDRLNRLFSQTLEKAGPVLIITAAGGMFGAIIKDTGVGDYAGKWLGETGMGLLVPFILAAFLKTAQGSSTVAIITAASIVSPMVGSLGLDSSMGKMLATLAMGAGSMVFSHANDSYFWVITKFSNLQPGSTLRVYSTATVVMGVTAFFMVWILKMLV